MKRNKKRLITALIIIVAVAAVLVFMKFFNGNLLYISTGMGKSVVCLLYTSPSPRDRG